LDLKNQGKKSAKTRKLGAWFSLHRVGGESRKPTKNQGEIQGSRNKVFWLDFCAINKGKIRTACAYTLWIGRVLGMRWPASMSPLRLDMEMFNFLIHFREYKTFLDNFAPKMRLC
jgi:hypothetical protein